MDFWGSQFSFLANCQTRAGAPAQEEAGYRGHSAYSLDNGTGANLKDCTVGMGAGSRNRLIKPPEQLLLGPSDCYMEAVVMALVVAFQD